MGLAASDLALHPPPQTLKDPGPRLQLRRCPGLGPGCWPGGYLCWCARVTRHLSAAPPAPWTCGQPTQPLPCSAQTAHGHMGEGHPVIPGGHNQSL